MTVQGITVCASAMSEVSGIELQTVFMLKVLNLCRTLAMNVRVWADSVEFEWLKNAK